MQPEKQCTRCGETKPLDAFPKRRDGRFGRAAQCLACRRERNREYDARPERREAERLKRQTPEHRAYMAAYAAANRDRINARRREYRRRRVEADPAIRRRAVEAQQRRYRRKREIVNEAKQGGCLVCGETEASCLDFHHRDPTTRLFTLGSNIMSRSEAAIRAEIAKCDVLCANCHRKLHAGVISLQPDLRAAA